MTEPAVSTADAKWEAVRRGAEAYNAPALTGADLGCLLHLAGRLSRQGGSFPVLHLAELLDLSARDLQFRTSQWLLGKVETDLERWALRGDNG